MTVALPGMAEVGTPELIIIVLVVLLLFGGKKLPEMARGTGRALRIFKAETKGLMTDDDDLPATTAPPAPQAPIPPPTAGNEAHHPAVDTTGDTGRTQTH